MEKLQPKLRFPKFRENWQTRKFNEFYSFKSTNSLSRENLNYVLGDVKNIHYGDIHTKFNSHFDISNEKVPFVNPQIDLTKVTDDNYIKEGDLVIADASEDYNDIGKSIEIIKLNNEKVLAGLHTFLARKESMDISTGFPTFLLKSRKVRMEIMKIAQGTKVLSLSSSRLGNIPLDFPTLPEQTKIASFLTTVDKKIAGLKKQLTLLERYKKGVMQKIFSQKLRFQDENGNDFPDWEEKKLGEICNIKRGASPRPITDKKWFDNNSKIGWVRISDISKSNKYLEKTEQYFSPSAIDKSRFVKKGNMIMSICATLGKPIYTNIDVCIPDSFIVFEKLSLEKEYFFYYLDFIQLNWYKYGQPGTQVNLNSEIVSNETIPVPSNFEQQKIASFLSSIDEKIIKCQGQIKTMENWKKGLLQQMFV